MKKFDIIIIGAGPGGYVAAIKGAQAGLKTLCIDKTHLGGICLNWGCIPTKALLKSAELYQNIKHSADFGITTSGIEFDYEKIIARSRKVSDTMTNGIEFLFKKNKVEYLQAEASIIASNLVKIKKADNSTEEISCDKIIIATGASPVRIPSFPVDNKNIIDYRSALSLTSKADKMLIIGAGAIGVEFAYFFNAFDTEVHLVEMAKQLLPVEDNDLAKILERDFKKQGIKTYNSSKVKELTVVQDGQVDVSLETSKGEIEKLTVNKVLVAIGMKPNSQGLNLETVNVQLGEKQEILVNENQETSVKNIYAIGDVAGKQMLAHKASFEAETAIKHIVSGKTHPIDYNQVPSCTYCQPQVASVGLTEEKAKSLGYELRIGKFPFTASGKAQAINHSGGLVKLIFDKKTGGLIGAHIIGYDATEMIAELGLALRLEATYDEIAQVIHAHPTLSEAIMEASMVADNKAVHI